MALTLHLSPDEEAKLAAAARDLGLDPAEWLKRVALNSLPASEKGLCDLDATLRLSQLQTGTALMPQVSTRELFAKWAAEDVRMTDEERDTQDRLWEEIERDLLENRGLHLRRAGE